VLATSEQLPSITGAFAVYTGTYGIPASLLGMGIQFDAQVWTGGAGTSTGGVTQPKQTWTGDNNNTYCSQTNPNAPAAGPIPYQSMVTSKTAANGYTSNFDTVADQSWLSYDPSGTGTTNESKDEFVSFDSPQSIAKKGVDLSAGAGLGGSIGGVFLFELSGDYAASAAAGSQHPLLDAANAMQNLLPGAVTNLTVTPGTGTATLKWGAAAFATEYKVYYSTTAGSAGTLGPVVTAGQATVSGLTAGKTYYFQVQPANAFGVATGGIATGSAVIPGLLTPTITWATPPSIAYGTPLTATQLDAAASVAGTFSYSPGEGAVLPVGANIVKATFIPSAAGYTSASATVTITVTAAALSTSKNLGSESVGSWSTAHSITISYYASNSATAAVSTEVLTKGANGQDFVQDASSCTYSASTSVHTCVVTVNFSPRAPGQRLGAVVMTINGAPVSTVYISGMGSGPQLAFDPGTASLVGIAGQISPDGVAVDGAGNVYLADYNYQKVLKITASGAASTYASGLSGQPSALAIDGAGNLYVALTTTVAKITQAGTVNTFASGLAPAPKGIAVDASGNVYIANTVAGSILKYTQAGTASTVLASTATIAGKSLLDPTGLALDSSGDLYISDSGNNRIIKVSASGTPAVVATTGLNSPFGIAVGGTGNLFIADEKNNRVVRVTPGGVQTTLLSGTVLGANLSFPIAVAVDSAESLYVSDSNNARLLRILRTTAGALSFAATKDGSTSADSPKTITVNNIGNANLILSVPAAGTNPSLSANFALGAGTSCPELESTSWAGTIASGSSCNYAVSFVPGVVGAISGEIVVTDNTLNVPNARQTVALSGTGQTSSPTPATVTLSGLVATFTGSPIAVTATTNPSGLAVSITYNGSTTAPASAGSYSIVATVTQSGYTGSASGTLVIAKATPEIKWPAPAAGTAPLTLGAAQLDATAANGTVSVAGTFAYTPAAGTVLAAGTYTLKAQFTPTDTIDYNTPAAAGQTLVVNTAAAPQRVVWVPDYYGGLLQVRVGTGTTPTAITVALPSCNPNAVAINNNLAYVVCNSDYGNADKIMVYNASTIRSAAAGTLSITPEQTITNAHFNSLIGITFDSSNNLWVASYGNGQVESISAASLNTATPAVTVNLISSPPSPVALAFDKNGSLWVTGQYNGGILLNFPASQLSQGAAAIPDYCLATTNLGAGCQYVDNVFLNPEGLALFNGDVWVANNNTGSGGNVPGREIVDLKYAPGTGGGMGTVTVNATFGSSTVASDSPFVCPGGLYGGSVHLWVNDESYGETNPQCGAAGDVASKTGGVFDFTAAQLAAESTTISQVLAYSGITGRPGFGGIFVENDQ
jgi:sugar lactone lactonase YvrE